jgi:hypothetical protein
MVPEKLITFAFALCDPCAETLGPLAHTYVEPDASFWARCDEAMREEASKGIDVTSIEGLTRAIDDKSSPLAKLAAEWRTRAHNEA